MRRSYPTDLSDVEWTHLKPCLPAPKKRGRGRPKIRSPRKILNAVFYLLKSGCPWRLLPRDFPPWKTVYHWFRKWRIDGTFERPNAALRERLRAPPAPLPSVGGRAGYQGRGKEWPEQELGLSVEVVHRTPKPTSEKIARIRAEEWAKEGREIDWQKLLPRRGFEVLPRRWVVERTFSWLSRNRRLSKDYERLCATSEAFVYAAMTRIMVRRSARA